MPTGHRALQPSRDATQTVPDGQTEQADAFMLRVAVENVAAGQSWQDAAPVADDHEPGGQGVQAVAPAAANVPAGQGPHSPVTSERTCPSVQDAVIQADGADEPVASVVVPTGHGKHVVETFAPEIALQVPIGHARQLLRLVAPTSTPYVPGGHAEHSARPWLAAYEPMRQAVQASSRAAPRTGLAVPTAQGRQPMRDWPICSFAVPNGHGRHVDALAAPRALLKLPAPHGSASPEPGQ